MNIKDAFKVNYADSLKSELKSIDVPELSVGDDKFKIYYRPDSISGEHFNELMMLFEKHEETALMFTAVNRLGLRKDGTRLFRDIELKSMMKGDYAPLILVRVGGVIVENVFTGIKTSDDAKKP